MERMKDVNTALSNFKIAATTQIAATEKGDYRKGNKAFEQIVHVIKYLKGLDRLNGTTVRDSR